MAESLYATMEGPKGKAEVFEVTQESTWVMWNEFPARAQTNDTMFEVRFEDTKQLFWQEGEAATVAWDLVGMPYGGDLSPRPAAPRRRMEVHLASVPDDKPEFTGVKDD